MAAGAAGQVYGRSVRQEGEMTGDSVLQRSDKALAVALIAAQMVEARR